MGAENNLKVVVNKVSRPNGCQPKTNLKVVVNKVIRPNGCVPKTI